MLPLTARQKYVYYVDNMKQLQTDKDNLLVSAAVSVVFQQQPLDTHSNKPSADTPDDSGTTTLMGERATTAETTCTHTHSTAFIVLNYFYQKNFSIH